MLCSHDFHDDCIKKWKVISMTCPYKFAKRIYMATILNFAL